MQSLSILFKSTSVNRSTLHVFTLHRLTLRHIVYPDTSLHTQECVIVIVPVVVNSKLLKCYQFSSIEVMADCVNNWSTDGRTDIGWLNLMFTSAVTMIFQTPSCVCSERGRFWATTAKNRQTIELEWRRSGLRQGWADYAIYTNVIKQTQMHTYI